MQCAPPQPQCCSAAKPGDASPASLPQHPSRARSCTDTHGTCTRNSSFSSSTHLMGSSCTMVTLCPRQEKARVGRCWAAAAPTAAAATQEHAHGHGRGMGGAAATRGPCALTTHPQPLVLCARHAAPPRTTSSSDAERIHPPARTPAYAPAYVHPHPHLRPVCPASRASPRGRLRRAPPRCAAPAAAGRCPG